MANDEQLETGTYEIIRHRLEAQATELRARMQALNDLRKDIFGGAETKLLSTDRVTTANYCTARDLTAVGDLALLGYNVNVGLREGIRISDVFAVYAYRDGSFKALPEATLLTDPDFVTDFTNLYRYYKEAAFARFERRGRNVYMVFHLTDKKVDVKALKWLLTDGKLTYVDNRSEHEIAPPAQYEFRWKTAGRDEQRSGRHPHVSILDRVFVETVGGDLTIKVEDNTDDGRGIYAEPVEYPDQTLDDAEFAYADLGNLIALRIRPYQEEARYFVFNENMQTVRRIEALARSGVLLPEGHGLIFANGYYLQTGEFKVFEHQPREMRFHQRHAAPNGEDYLFVFTDDREGRYTLLPYNIISQQVATPIQCNGYTLLPAGELCYFGAEEEATRHHVIQVWQTPFTDAEREVKVGKPDHYLAKVGNKNIVRAMAEVQEILTLTTKEDSYGNLYDELVRRATTTLDAHYWLDQEAAADLAAPLRELRTTAETAIDEYERKEAARRRALARQAEVTERLTAAADRTRRATFSDINDFVVLLTEVRSLRGAIVELSETKYTEPAAVAALDERAAALAEQLARACTEWLLRDDALTGFTDRMAAQETRLETTETARAVAEVTEELEQISADLELLTQVVSNLKIDDATQTTAIVERISDQFTGLNRLRAAAKRRAGGFADTEAGAEFAAQLRLLDQATLNYLDLADTPEATDDYLTRLMVQLEELEGRFAESESFIEKLAEKRAEVYAAFEGRKNSLTEARDRRAAGLEAAADRIVKGISRRANAFKTEAEISAYFAADLMVDKVRDLVRQLEDLGHANRAGELQANLKTLREEAVRQLTDRNELLEDGDRIIRLGKHRFAVNRQPLELTVVQREGHLYYHLTGTHFYTPLNDPSVLATRPVWGQALISENRAVYRAEYLAYSLLQELRGEDVPDEEALAARVTTAAGTRYEEGYTRGVHDADAAKILAALLTIDRELGRLRYRADLRAAALYWWTQLLDEDTRAAWKHQTDGAAAVLAVFPHSREADYLTDRLAAALAADLSAPDLYPELDAARAAAYLLEELTDPATAEAPTRSPAAAELHDDFLAHLKKNRSLTRFRQSLTDLAERTPARLQLVRQWLRAYVAATPAAPADRPVLEETAVSLLRTTEPVPAPEVAARSRRELTDLLGEHEARVGESGTYQLDYHEFTERLARFEEMSVPLFRQFRDVKRELSKAFSEELRLEEFKPQVLSSFVRNRLIDEVYLPLFGNNLAKQMGTAGADTRTDRMGLLLLISPPGYGKTTLMEYVADRLGLIFVKVNGPALGHQVTGLAPSDAPSLAAARELEKLNLALEMGDNIMLYVDDIQHCSPEFLQKFISLCDAQRKIEGVWEGRAKTYDLRGRRLAVVMAGNPYTESGDKFRVPDMLANRADIYNLGDILGDQAAAFRLSYLENALTSNTGLSRLVAAGGRADFLELVRALEAGSADTAQLTGNYSAAERAEYVGLLQKLLRVRDVVLDVNQAYIRSAATNDAYRTEPAFRLQGSYRDMNKLAERIVPIMNDRELESLILSHYQRESQTLTNDAEANYLRLKGMVANLTPEEGNRWTEIKLTFDEQRRAGAGLEERMGELFGQLGELTDEIEGIRRAVEKRGGKGSSR